MTHRILLADDSVTIRRVVELTFSDENFAIDSVGDGALALERARAVRPDIIISDVAMPGLDGYELCRKIKAEPSLRSVPFLFLKGTFESFDEQKASSCGADGFIVKPFESQEMITRVKEMIAGAALAPAAGPARPVATPAAIPAAPARRIVQPVPVELPAAPPPSPSPVTGPSASRPNEDFGFDFGEALSESFGSPAAPSAAGQPPAPPPEPTAEMEEDLWSEVSLRDHASDLLETRPTPGSGDWPGGGIRDLEEEAEDSADETLFDEMPGPRKAAPIEPEPEAARAIVSSLAAPPAPHPARIAAAPATPVPAAPAAQPAVDPAEIERIVAARMEAVVRQVLEPVVRDLARTMIETVSWEVIPDLAEAMIRAEIERISQSTRTG